jgi:hypothetical protein
LSDTTDKQLLYSEIGQRTDHFEDGPFLAFTKPAEDAKGK